MPFDYYDKKLGAKKLRRVYEIAPPRVKQYLEAEVRHVLSLVRPGGIVLELGCGYGRVLKQLALQAGELYGVDTSVASLVLARSVLSEYENVFLAQMNAARLALRDHCFDVVVCVQNGISAFHVDQKQLIQESIRVTKPGGLVLFSSYSHRFWNERLHWFELQAKHGLLGEIDYEKTGHGVMVCKDGFTATTVEEHRFMELCQDLSTQVNVVEVDDSSLFCEIRL